MHVYLASPLSQMQADYCREMPVLLSYAPIVHKHNQWLWQYAPSFERILIDSGAYSELNGTHKLDVHHYAEWSQSEVVGRIDAIAGLDDISGDWRRSMKNYEAFPQGFPTFHDTDPDELLDDLIPNLLRCARRGRAGYGAFLGAALAGIEGMSAAGLAEFRITRSCRKLLLAVEAVNSLSHSLFKFLLFRALPAQDARSALGRLVIAKTGLAAVYGACSALFSGSSFHPHHAQVPVATLGA